MNNDFEKIENLVSDYIVDGNVYEKFKQIITEILRERAQLKVENEKLRHPISYLADLQQQIHSLKEFNIRQVEEIKQLRARLDDSIIPCGECIYYDRFNCQCCRIKPPNHNPTGCVNGERLPLLRGGF